VWFELNFSRRTSAKTDQGWDISERAAPGAITSAIATCFRFTCCTRRPRANAGNIFVPCQCALRWSSRTLYGIR